MRSFGIGNTCMYRYETRPMAHVLSPDFTSEVSKVVLTSPFLRVCWFRGFYIKGTEAVSFEKESSPAPRKWVRADSHGGFAGVCDFPVSPASPATTSCHFIRQQHHRNRR